MLTDGDVAADDPDTANGAILAHAAVNALTVVGSTIEMLVDAPDLGAAERHELGTMASRQLGTAVEMMRAIMRGAPDGLLHALAGIDRRCV